MGLEVVAPAQENILSDLEPFDHREGDLVVGGLLPSWHLAARILAEPALRALKLSLAGATDPEPRKTTNVIPNTAVFANPSHRRVLPTLRLVPV